MRAIAVVEHRGEPETALGMAAVAGLPEEWNRFGIVFGQTPAAVIDLAQAVSRPAGLVQNWLCYSLRFKEESRDMPDSIPLNPPTPPPADCDRTAMPPSVGLFHACDICLTGSAKHLVPAATVVSAANSGFDPFASQLIPPFFAGLWANSWVGRGGALQNWKTQVAGAHSGLRLCDGCLAALQRHCGTIGTAPVPADDPRRALHADDHRDRDENRRRKALRKLDPPQPLSTTERIKLWMLDERSEVNGLVECDKCRAMTEIGKVRRDDWIPCHTQTSATFGLGTKTTTYTSTPDHTPYNAVRTRICLQCMWDSAVDRARWVRRGAVRVTWPALLIFLPTLLFLVSRPIGPGLLDEVVVCSCIGSALILIGMWGGYWHERGEARRKCREIERLGVRSGGREPEGISWVRKKEVMLGEGANILHSSFFPKA